MRCPHCRESVIKADAGWYCPVCNTLVDPAARQRPAKPVSSASFQPVSPLRRVLGFIALGIPLLFLILPQVSCTGISNNSFTGLALLQIFTGGGTDYGSEMIRESVGGLVVFAAFALALACLLAGIIGLASFKASLAPVTFSVVGIVGLAASFLGLIARGDQSLQGLNVRLEAGFYLISLAFLLLFLAPGIERGLEKLFPLSAGSEVSTQQKE